MVLGHLPSHNFCGRAKFPPRDPGPALFGSESTNKMLQQVKKPKFNFGTQNFLLVRKFIFRHFWAIDPLWTHFFSQICNFKQFLYYFDYIYPFFGLKFSFLVQNVSFWYRILVISLGQGSPKTLESQKSNVGPV